jgi:hypothetical protein
MYLPSERFVLIGFGVGGFRGVVERGRGGKVKCGDDVLGRGVGVRGGSEQVYCL